MEVIALLGADDEFVIEKICFLISQYFLNQVQQGLSNMFLFLFYVCAPAAVRIYRTHKK